MKSVFYVLAALMIVLAMALLLAPLLRRGRSRGMLVLALLIALALPLGSAGLYLFVGTPIALDGATRQADAPATFEQALRQLRQHLATAPADTQTWLLLAQTYIAMQRPSDARDSYDQVLRLDPANLSAMVGWAEADAAARPKHRIDGRARQLLEQAARIDPRNQRVLWLTGIAQFQTGQYHAAAANWRLLLPLLPADSQIAAAVSQQIAEAERRIDTSTAPAAAVSSAAPATSTALRVRVSLAPALQSRLAAGDTLFVYARAANGSPMPLAVARLPAAALPAMVTLTDAMAMAPSAKLSSATAVFVGARVSKSGQAVAQPGDLEGDAGVVARDRETPVEIIIDKVHG